MPQSPLCESLLAVGHRLGWPEIECEHGPVVAGGEPAWQVLAASLDARPVSLGAALTALLLSVLGAPECEVRWLASSIIPRDGNDVRVHWVAERETAPLPPAHVVAGYADLARTPPARFENLIEYAVAHVHEMLESEEIPRLNTLVLERYGVAVVWQPVPLPLPLWSLYHWPTARHIEHVPLDGSVERAGVDVWGVCTGWERTATAA